MNKIFVLAALATAALAAQAQEQGRVLSATPITEQIAIPQQVCGNETIYSGARPTSGAGAVLGNQIEGGRPGYQNVQRCTTETYYDNQIVGYDVVYEYAGRHYNTRTQTDPGAWIPLTVQPAVPGVSRAPAGYPPTYAPTYSPTYSGGYAQPGVVVSTQPGPPAYIVEPPVTVIEYRDNYGHPYRPPRYHDRYWR